MPKQGTQHNTAREVIVSGFLAGAVVATLDLADVVLDGFGVTLGTQGATRVVAYAIVAMGGFGVVCYAMAYAGWSALSRFSDADRVRRVLPALALALSVLLGAACLYLRIGGRMRYAPMWLLPVATLALIFIRIVDAKSSQSTPAGWPASLMYFLAFAVTFITGSRVVYSVSRFAGQMMACVHVLVIAALLAGLAAWFHTKLVGRLHGKWGLLLSTMVALASLSPVNALELEPDGRLLLLERTTLTFQIARAHPITRVQPSDTIPSELLAEGTFKCEVKTPQGRLRDDTTSETSSMHASELSGTVADVGSIDISIVWILVDTLRADRLQASLDGVPLMPAMTRFRQSAADFSHTYAPATKTKYSVPAMLVGEFVASDWADSPLEKKHAFARRLAANGVESRVVLSHSDLKIAFEAFDVVDATVAEVDAHRRAVTSEQVTARARQHLQQLREERPFLLVAHYFDPHDRYVPHGDGHWWQLPETLYDAEVAYTDLWIGKLLQAVDEARRDGPIAVVISSDHGDEFWDHRYGLHVLRVYDESARIVFLVNEGPNQSPQRFDTPVSGMDIGPTILDLFGIVAPPSGQGQSLVDSIRAGVPPPRRPILMHSGDFRAAAVVDYPYKLIWNRDSAFGELYDLAKDPAERRNLLYRHRPERVVQELAGRLQCFLQQLPSSRD